MLSTIGLKRKATGRAMARGSNLFVSSVMRIAIGLAAAGVLSICVGAGVWMTSAASPEKIQPAEKTVAAAAPAPQAAPAPKAETADITGTVPAPEAKPAPAPAAAKRACANPNALGI